MDLIVLFIGRLFAVFAIFVIMPLGIGRLLYRVDGAQDWGLTFLFGLFGELTLFDVFYFAAFFSGLSFSLMTALFFIAAVPTALGGFLRGRKDPPIRAERKAPLSKAEKIALAVFGAVVLCQMLRVTFRAGTGNIDDGWYLAIANSAIESDEILRYDVLTGYPYDYSQHIAENMEYVFSPWPLFCAAVARVTNMQITVLMRTLLPSLLIAMFYYVLYRLVLFVFTNEREKALTAMAILAVFYELASVSVCVKYSWMLCYPWMGKGFGVSVLCPAVLLLFLLEQEEEDARKKKLLLWGIFLGNIAGCTAASSCAEINLISLGCWGLVSLLRKRDFSLVWKLSLCVTPSLLLMGSHLLA